jgi:two-component system nitrate/nitrite response regulator NarL
LVQEGIRRILSQTRFEVVAVYDFLEEVGAAKAASSNEASILLINGDDIELEEATFADLRQRLPNPRALIFTQRFELSQLMQALAVGVSGYLVSDLSAARLVESLETLAAGEKVLPAQLLDALRESTSLQDDDVGSVSLKSASLTDREIQLLGCLVSGMPNKLISRRLNITEATVKVHVRAVLRKLNLRNRTQAAMWAATRGVGSALDESDAGGRAADYTSRTTRSAAKSGSIEGAKRSPGQEADED